LKQRRNSGDTYVESNFVLEFALSQEQHDSCERILELAEAGRINLIVPAYSLVEPYETLVRRAKKRAEVSLALDGEVKQLSRSRPYYDEIDAMQQVSGLIARCSAEEKERFRIAVSRLLAVAKIIPLDTEILAGASKHQLDHDLSFQDAIVYASVLKHLSTSAAPAKCFLNRNSKDFDDPDIEETLNSYGCKMLFSFDEGYRYITRPEKHA